MNKDIPLSLQTYIEQEIIPCYEQFDTAHQTDHARTVIDESLKIAPYYKVNPIMVYTVAAYHDIGLCEGRELHHIVSAQMLRADKRLKEWFTDEQICIMAEAVEDHRASNQNEPRSIYGKIIAEADRIIDPTTTLLRTVQYGLSHYPQFNQKEQYIRFRKHLLEKYAEGGYLKLWIPESDNAIRLTELRHIIADEIKLKKVFNRLFGSEMTKRKNNQRNSL